jgi:hypothetical protein
MNERNVKDGVLAPFEHDRLKHDLGDFDWTEERLNSMTRLEFLECVSNAVEKRLEPIEKALRHLLTAAARKPTKEGTT